MTLVRHKRGPVSSIWASVSTCVIFCQHHWNLHATPVRLELTPSSVTPNHPRGLYYKGLAAHLTPQRRRGAGGEIGTSAPLSFHMVEHHTHSRTHTCTHRQVVCSRATASVCYTRQQREHLTLHLSAGEKPIKKTDVRVAAVLADSTKRLTSLYVCYMLMLMSLLQDQSRGLTPEVQERNSSSQ